MTPYVFFDVGNTLVLPDAPRLAALAGIPNRVDIIRRLCYQIRVAMEKQLLFTSTEHNDVFIDFFTAVFECSAGISRESARDLAHKLKAIDRTDNIFSMVNEEAPALLERLKGHGIRMSVISNADGRIDALLTRLGLRGYFERVYDSHLVGLEKPDVRFFQKALTDLNCQPDNAYYLGDLRHIDYLPSVAAGMRGILYDPYDNYEQPEHKVKSLSDFGRLVMGA